MFYSFTVRPYQLPLALLRQKKLNPLIAWLLQKNIIKSDRTEFQPDGGLHHETKLNKELLELFFPLSNKQTRPLRYIFF